MLMQAKNAVGFNTPGAASSAADLESQEPPKSRPKPQKIDVDKQVIFGIDFLRARPSFWNGFWDVFRKKNARKMQNNDFNENLKISAPVEAKH